MLSLPVNIDEDLEGKALLKGFEHATVATTTTNLEFREAAR